MYMIHTLPFPEKQQHGHVPTSLLTPGLQSTHKWTGDLNLGRLDGQWRTVFLTPAEERSQGEKEVLRRSKNPILPNIPTGSRSSDLLSQLLLPVGNGGAGKEEARVVVKTRALPWAVPQLL